MARRKVYYANVMTEKSYPSSIKKIKVIAKDSIEAFDILDKQYPNNVQIDLWHTLKDYKLNNK